MVHVTGLEIPKPLTPVIRQRRVGSSACPRTMSSDHTPHAPVPSDTHTDHSDSSARSHGSAHAVEDHSAPMTVAEMEAAARDAKAKKAHDEIFSKTETF